MDRINTLLIALQNNRQSGQAMVEYGLLAGLISVVAIVSLTTAGTDVKTIFTAVASALTTAAG